MKKHTVRIGDYTNKKNVTKTWLFVEEEGKSWGALLISPEQCVAILANTDKLKQFVAASNRKQAEARPAPVVVPEPEPESVEDSTDAPLDPKSVDLVKQLQGNPALAAALAALAKGHTNIAGTTANRNGNGKHSLARR